MAVDLRCPNCDDNLGKDVENDALAYCGNCGESDIYNERGDTSNMIPHDVKKFNTMKRRRQTRGFIGTNWS